MSGNTTSVSRTAAAFDLSRGGDQQWDVDDVAALTLHRMREAWERQQRESRARRLGGWAGRLAVAVAVGLTWLWMRW